MKKFLSVAVVTAMLASMTAIPVSAKSVNDYTLSYATLASSFETTEGIIVPEGTIAVTMNIAENQGFNYNTLAMEIETGFEVLTDSDGNPIVKLGDVLDGFSSSCALSDDGSKLCVAVASANRSSQDGELFTVYCNPTTLGLSTAISSRNTSVQPATITPPCPEQVINTRDTNDSIVGDIDSDSTVNSYDAYLLLVGINDFYDFHTDLTRRTYIRYSYLRGEWGTSAFGEYYPDVTSPYAVNCKDTQEAYDNWYEDRLETRVIDSNDSDEILFYAATTGAGNTYTPTDIARVGVEFNSITQAL